MPFKSLTTHEALIRTSVSAAQQVVRQMFAVFITTAWLLIAE